jgi:lysozyme
VRNVTGLFVIGLGGFFLYKSAKAASSQNPTYNYVVPDLLVYPDNSVDTIDTIHPNSLVDYSAGNSFLGDLLFDPSSLISDYSENVTSSSGSNSTGWLDENPYDSALNVDWGVIDYSFGNDDVGTPETINQDQLISEIADHLMAKEGLRTYVYDDFNGKPWTQSKIGKATIGYGHLVMPGESFGTITEGEAYSLLISDIIKNFQPITPAVKVPLSISQWVAIASLAFNVGPGAVKNSSFLKALNSGDKAGAEAGFKAWNKITVNGQKVVSNGLKNRREAEWALFTDGSPVVYLA